MEPRARYARAKVAIALLTVLVGATTHAQTVVDTFGAGQFIGINGIDVDNTTGRIYVTDAGNVLVRVWESDRTFAFSIGSGVLTQSPCGVLVDPANDRLYVSESKPGPGDPPGIGNRVHIFDRAGNLQSTFGTAGTGDGQFDSPCQMAFFSGTLLVADALNDRIQQFDLAGNHQNSVPMPVSTLSGLMVRQDRIFVSDSLGDRVLEVATDGSIINQWGVTGTAAGEFMRPSNLYAGSFLYVADAFNERFQVFDYDGNFVDLFDGIGDATFGIAVDRNEQVFTDADFLVQVVTFDRDADGLLDAWETLGLDADGDGTIDVDLPALGADPDHKDLFWEVDWMSGHEPTRADITAIKEAFASAPVNAGGVPNPDGQPGINLWVDTGSLTDPGASEDGAGLGTCGDGIDNGGGDGMDAADDDCLVADDFGGGNQVPTSSIDNLDSDDNMNGSADFYEVKGANFDPDRAMAFRYHLSAAPPTTSSGGWGEVGGNDTIEYNHDPGTRMHEWGHNLNLRHGGFESSNCKPSYVSVMNYDHQFGIRRNAGVAGQDLDGNGADDGRIIDFAPPRFNATTPGGRGAALPTLAEDNLDETALLDATDAANQLAFVNDNGDKTRSALDTANNYSGDMDSSDTGLTVNVDTSDITSGRPGDCTNATITSNPPGLQWYDDWMMVSLPFLQFGDSANGSINPVETPSPDRTALLEIEMAFNSTDLAVTKTALPSPVEIGDNLLYEIELTNNGPNPANAVSVIDTLPSEVGVLSTSAVCGEGPAGTVTCGYTNMLPNDVDTASIRVDTTNACVGGVPVTLTNEVSVANVSDMAGPDKEPVNNDFSLDVLPVDTTPPELTVALSREILWPPNHKMHTIEATVAATDICDDDPDIELVSIVSNEPDNGQGDGNTVNDVQNADFGTEDTSFALRSERSGKGSGRIYTITYKATDGSGNETVVERTVSVAHNK